MHSIFIVMAVFVHCLMISGDDNHANQQIMTKLFICPADMNPCYNGGICVSVGQVGEFFECICTAGWAGPLCDYPDAPSNTCSTNPCLNGGACIIASNGGFQCICPAPYTGVLCQTGNVVSNNCNINPCVNGGICVPLSTTTFTCRCPFGWTGPFCNYYNGICQSGKKNSLCLIPRAIHKK